MSELYLLKTVSRAAIAAAVVAGTLDKRRPTIEADGGRLRIGNHIVTETNRLAASVSSAGTTTLALKSWCPVHVGSVAASAGAGSYTRKIVVPLTTTDLDGGTSLAPLEGDIIELALTFAASANPTLQIRNENDSGTLLATIAGTGSAFTRTVKLYYNGAAWAVLQDGTDIDAEAAARAAADALKAPLASPALTGTPTAPTAAPGTNTTQVSTTAFVVAAIAALVNSSPSALDTLNELAAALGNDASFATTVTNALAAKQPLDADLTALAAAGTGAELAKAGVHGADIASASTLNLESATGQLVDVTGTTTITAVTLSEGHVRLVRHTGAVLYTHGSSLVCPAGVNFTTAAGDCVMHLGYGSGVVRVIHFPAHTPAGLALARAADAAAQVALLAGALASYNAQTISASGDSTPTIGSPHHTQDITLSGATSGTGARVSLATTGRVAGDIVRMPVSFAADASRLRVYHATTGGTLLLDQENDGTARLFFAEFTYTGSAWKLTHGSYYA
jgi:hypothetical protein